MNKKLIFDIGMHKGDDTRFYLDKGFYVVGVEANPFLCATVSAEFADEITIGRLRIVSGALWHHTDHDIDFYVSAEKDDWGSLYKDYAEKGLYPASGFKVRTITLTDLIVQFGIPYYIKCDIEGADGIFAQQLLQSPQRPAFVSMEALTLNELAYFRACGYDRFQITNQLLNSETVPPFPAREGQFIKSQFSGHMSGLFGLELDPEKWIDFEVACDRFLAWRRLRWMDDKLAYGWFDFHAGRSEFLEDQFPQMRIG